MSAIFVFTLSIFLILFYAAKFYRAKMHVAKMGNAVAKFRKMRNAIPWNGLSVFLFRTQPSSTICQMDYQAPICLNMKCRFQQRCMLRLIEYLPVTASQVSMRHIFLYGTGPADGYFCYQVVEILLLQSRQHRNRARLSILNAPIVSATLIITYTSGSSCEIQYRLL